MKYLLAILFPPLAILLCGGKFIQAFLNLFLCMLLWVPGIIHALLVVNSYESEKRTTRIVDAIERTSHSSTISTNTVLSPAPIRPGSSELTARVEQLGKHKLLQVGRSWKILGWFLAPVFLLIGLAQFGDARRPICGVFSIIIALAGLPLLTSTYDRWFGKENASAVRGATAILAFISMVVANSYYVKAMKQSQTEVSATASALERGVSSGKALLDKGGRRPSSGN